MAVNPIHEQDIQSHIGNLPTTYAEQWGYPSTYVTLDHEMLMAQPPWNLYCVDTTSI